MEITIGSAPPEEQCAQLGEDNYPVRARAECRRFISQLRRVAAAANIDLGALTLHVKGFSHDFGTYYEVVAQFDEGDEVSSTAAYWLEANTPETWDDEALLDS